MNSTGSEKDWIRAASTPPAAFTSRSSCSRDDLFLELDYLVADLGTHDELFRSSVRRRVTRIRALAATLIPADNDYVCGYQYESGAVCQQKRRSQTAIEDHRSRVHGVPSDPAA